MIRIVLPLAIIASLMFAPLFTETIEGSVLGEMEQAQTGEAYFAPAVDCVLNQNYDVFSKDCQPRGGMTGTLLFVAVAASALAAAGGVIGLLPVIGRLTSILALAAGAVTLGAVGVFLLGMVGGDGLGGVQWGAWLTGILGLLTTGSGLSGMRGDR